jgi:hypothetical protein
MHKFLKEIKLSEFYMKIKEKLYPQYNENPVYDLRYLYAKAMIRFDTCETRKKNSQIRSEIQIYKKFWKCYPYDYFFYDLYREENTLTPDELINYIPSFFWFYLYLPHHTSYKYHMITDNKIATEQYFHGVNISQPVTLCRIVNGILYSPHMQLLTYDEVMIELTKKNYEKVFVKPAVGGGSKGIYIFHRTGVGLYSTDQQILFNEEFLSSIGTLKDYILQPGILQDHQISKMYPESINTFRIITENKKGDVRVICAMLRIGRGGKEVDNASAGGIFIKIDTKSGTVGSYAMSYDCEKFSKHPDTHFEFQTVKISRWDEIVKFTTDSAGKLPFFTHLAWDVALTVDGPLAVETNLGFGIEGLQISHGGLREAFRIENPDYYWKNPGRRIEYIV